MVRSASTTPTRFRSGQPVRAGQRCEGPGGGEAFTIGGAGKGTQGALIATHIATGDPLRDHVARETELGRAVRDRLGRGELVPDEVVLEME